MNIGDDVEIVEFSFNCVFDNDGLSVNGTINPNYLAEYNFYDVKTGIIFARYRLFKDFRPEEVFLTNIVRESLCNFLLESTKYFSKGCVYKMVDLMTLKKRVMMNNKIEELWN